MRASSTLINVVWLLAFIFLIANVSVSLYNGKELVANEKAVAHTREVKLELATIESFIKDAETAQRGFQVTGLESYLEPYQTAIDFLPAHLANLQTLVADSPQQSERVAQLVGLTRDKLFELAKAIEIRRGPDGREAGRQWIAAGVGKELMDNIRILVRVIDAREDSLLNDRTDLARSKYRATTLTTLIGAVISVGMVGLAFYLVRREFGLRRQAEMDVRISLDRLRLVTESIPQLVFDTDAAGLATYVNRRWVEYTGLTPEQIWEKGGWTTAAHPDDASGLAEAWDGARQSGKDFSSEVRMRAVDGSYRWMLATAVPLVAEAGRVVQWVGALTDIEDQKRQEDRLQELVRERTRDLERSNGELEKFAYVASHDLQEPLRKILAFGDRLTRKCGDQLDQLGREYLERIESSAARMRTLIEDLLAFSRVASKATPFKQVDLGAIVRDVLLDLEIRLAQTGGQVAVGPLPTIDADPLQMRQLFQNLLGNALKFRRPNVPPVVKVTAEAILDDDERTRWQISVTDNGIGFDEVYLDRIFEVFQRLHGREAYEGTGIGLAICRKIVDRHGGTITAASTPGAGATFLINLPAIQAGSTE